MSNRIADRLEHVSVSLTATGDLVAAPAATQKIRVIGYVLTSTADFTAQFKSGTTAISGAMQLIKGVPNAPFGVQAAPVLECAAGEKLNLTLSGTGTVAGFLVYELIYVPS